MSLILFTAPSWCAPCKVLEQQMTNAMKAQVQPVDPQQNTALANKYGVLSIPTLVDQSTGQKYTGNAAILEFLKSR